MKLSKTKDIAKNVHIPNVMKKSRRLVPAGVSRAVSMKALEVSKNSPKILFVAGVGGFIATTVLVGKATLKVDEIREEHAKTKLGIQEMTHAEYTEQDRASDLRLLGAKTTLAYAKLYAPAVIVGSLSVAALVGSHTILSNRHAAVGAALVATEQALADYRKRVITELGADKDREFRYGKEERTIVEEDEHGPVTKQIVHYGPNGASQYAKFFNKDNANWEPTPEYNLIFIRSVQNYMNDRLVTKGYVLLNDVYDALGMERTKAGRVVGWVYDKTGNNLEGDNQIDFGVWHDRNLDRFHDFQIGRESELLLDFNVDGNIHERI